MNEDSRLSFRQVGALPTLKGIPVLVEGTLLLAGSLPAHPEALRPGWPRARGHTKRLGETVLARKSLRAT